MPQLVEMDRHVSLFEQMEEQVGSVVLINTFTVEPEEALQAGLQQPRVPGEDAGLPIQRSGFASPGEEGSGARNLRRVGSL